MSAVAANVGDPLVQLTCCEGTVLVLATRADEWRCDRCGQPGRHGGSFVLARVGWRPA